MDRQKYFREYRLKNKDKINAWAKIYYAKNREKMLLKGEQYRKKYPDKIKEYYQNNKNRFLIYNRKQSRIKRLEVLSYYSKGKLKCNCCGEMTYEFLSIDHIIGGGGKHRRLLRGRNFYLWLVKENFPKGYQVLCHNCNQAKGLYGKCPHQKYES